METTEIDLVMVESSVSRHECNQLLRQAVRDATARRRSRCRRKEGRN